MYETHVDGYVETCLFLFLVQESSQRLYVLVLSRASPDAGRNADQFPVIGTSSQPIFPPWVNETH